MEDVRVNINNPNGGSGVNGSNSNQQTSATATPRHTETPLVPPGRILYCFPNLPVEDRMEVSEGEWEYTWCEAREYANILISPFMLRHHFPEIVLRALAGAAAQAAQDSEP